MWLMVVNTKKPVKSCVLLYTFQLVVERREISVLWNTVVSGWRSGTPLHSALSLVGFWELPSRCTSSSSCCLFWPVWCRCPSKTTAALSPITLPAPSIQCCATLTDLLLHDNTHKHSFTNTDQQAGFLSKPTHPNSRSSRVRERLLLLSKNVFLIFVFIHLILYYLFPDESHTTENVFLVNIL